MSDDERNFATRLRRELAQASQEQSRDSRRHPARDSPQYRELKHHTAGEIEELCERLVRELRISIEEIDRTVAEIADASEDQLARGAVSDVFDAAATALRKQVRGEGSSSGKD